MMRPARAAPKWGRVVFQVLVWSTLFISMAGMSWAALAPQVPIPTYFPQQDKVEHLVGFFVLGALLALGAGHRAYWFSLGFCLTLSIGVEYAQKALTTTREFSLDDAAASALGGFIGLSFFSLCLWMGSLIVQKRLKPARGGSRAGARRASDASSAG